MSNPDWEVSCPGHTPSRGVIEEPACAVHERVILAAVRTLGMGCSGESFESMQCARCTNEGKDERTWLPNYVVEALLPASTGATYPQVAPEDPQVGWLQKWINRVRRSR